MSVRDIYGKQRKERLVPKIQEIPTPQAAAPAPSSGDPLLGALGSIAGTAIGGAIGGPAGAAVGGSIGGQLGGKGTVDVTKTATDAAQGAAGDMATDALTENISDKVDEIKKNKGFLNFFSMGGKVMEPAGKLKKFTQKDKEGNTFTYEFDVPPMQDIPHPGGPKGTDTVPAWLTPGERVMNAEAERMYGPVLKQMNDEGRAIQRAQGGTIPDYAAMGCKVKYKAQGGPVYANEGTPVTQGTGFIPFDQMPGFDVIKDAEGFKPYVYDDPVKGSAVPTVGYGHKLLPEEIEAVSKGKKFSQDELEQMYMQDYLRAQQDARNNIPGFNQMSPEMQGAFTSQAFQLGGQGQADFDQMIAAIDAGDKNKAIQEVYNSDWAKQTPSRAEYLANAIKEGSLQQAKGAVQNELAQAEQETGRMIPTGYLNADIFDEGGAFPPPKAETPPAPEEDLSIPEQFRQWAFGDKRSIQDRWDGDMSVPENVRNFVTGDPRAPQERTNLFSDLYRGVNKINDKGIESPDTIGEFGDITSDLSADPSVTVDQVPTVATERQVEQDLLPQYQAELDEWTKTGGDPNAFPDLETYAKASVPAKEDTPPEVKAPPKEEVKAKEEAFSNLVNQQDEDNDEPLVLDEPETTTDDGRQALGLWDSIKGMFDSDTMKSVTDSVGDAFDNMLDTRQLTTAAIMYLGSRALGYDHGGSLQFVAKNYAKGIQTKNTAADKLILENKHTKDSIEEYRRTGDMSNLVAKPVSPKRVSGKPQVYYTQDNKKQNLYEYEDANGNKYLGDGQGNPVKLDDLHSNPSRVPGTDEFKKAQFDYKADAVKNYKSLEERFGSTDDDKPLTNINPTTAAGETAYWAAVNQVPVERMSSIMESAYLDAIEHQKRTGQKVSDIRPFLNQQVLRTYMDNPSILMSKEKDENGNPIPLNADKLRGVNTAVARRLGVQYEDARVSDVLNQYMSAKEIEWNELQKNNPDKFNMYSNGANKDENGFLLFIQDDLNILDGRFKD